MPVQYLHWEVRIVIQLMVFSRMQGQQHRQEFMLRLEINLRLIIRFQWVHKHFMLK